MKIQCSVALKTAKSLPIDKLTKLVYAQARRIGLAEWETEQLVRVCNDKGCLDKGLSVLYEFAGYIDRINVLLTRRTALREKVFLHLKITPDCSNNPEFIRDIAKLAETTAKLLYTVSMWRKLNWNPRPIYTDLSNSTALDCIFPTLISSRPTIQTMLREEAYQIMSATQDNEVDLFSILSWNVLVVLLSPVIDKKEFTSILQRRHNNVSHASSSLEASFEPIELSKSLKVSFNSIRSILAYEDDIERVWSGLRNGLSEATVDAVKEQYPIIRIPYSGVICEYEGFHWYSLSAITEYSSFASALSAEIKGGAFELGPSDTFPFSPSLTSLDGGVFSSSLVMSGDPGFGMQASGFGEASIVDTSLDDGAYPDAFFRHQAEEATGSIELPIKEPAVSINENSNLSPSRRKNGTTIDSKHPDKLLSQSASGEPSTKPTGSLPATSATAPSSPSDDSNLLSKDQGAEAVVAKDSTTPLKKEKSRRSNGTPVSQARSVIESKLDSTSLSSDNADEEQPVDPGDSPRDVTHKGRSAIHTVLSPSLKAVNKFLSNKGSPTTTITTVSMSPKISSKAAGKPSTQGAKGRRTTKIQSTKTQSQSDSKLESIEESKPTWAPHGSTPTQSLMSRGKSVSQPILPSESDVDTTPSKEAHHVAPESGPVPGSGTNFQLYQFYEGNFIPVVIQPTIPVNYQHHDTSSPGIVVPPQYLDSHLSGQNPDIATKMSPSLMKQHPPVQRGDSNPWHLPTAVNSFTGSILEDEEDEGIVQKTPSIRGLPPSRASSGLSSNPESRQHSAYLRPSSSQSRLVSASPKPSSGKHRDRQSSGSTSSGVSTPRGNTIIRPAAKHFTSKQMESLGILASVSSVKLRGEVLADGQVMSVAFKYINMGGGTLLHLAARKIALWWRLFYPRRKFLKRMSIKLFLLDIVSDMANAAVAHSIICKRRRLKFLREGGATKIQRCFRHYRDTILAEEKAQEILERKQTAKNNLEGLCRVLRVCVYVHRFIKAITFKRYSKRYIKVKQSQKIVRRGPSFKVSCEVVFVRIKDRRLREALEHINANAKHVVRHNNRAKVFKEREVAAIRLQNVGRVFFSKKIFKKKKFERAMRRKILSFFIRSHYIFKKLQKLKRHQSAVKIQKRVRGMLLRRELAIQVKAGMLLNQLWRKHRAFRTLKQNLRRVEKPVNIIIRGVRNIPAQLIHTESLKIKISVWWHPLLHIISESDFSTIIQNKQPQYIYVTKPSPLLRAAQPDTSASSQNSRQINGGTFLKASGRFRLSSLFGTMLSPSPSQAHMIGSRSNSMNSTPVLKSGNNEGQKDSAPAPEPQPKAPMLPSEMVSVQKGSRNSAPSGVTTGGINRRSFAHSRSSDLQKPPLPPSAIVGPTPGTALTVDKKDSSAEEDSLSLSNSLEGVGSGAEINGNLPNREDSMISALSEPTFEPKRVEAISSVVSALSSGDEDSMSQEPRLAKSRSKKSISSAGSTEKRGSIRKKSRSSFRSGTEGIAAQTGDSSGGNANQRNVSQPTQSGDSANNALPSNNTPSIVPASNALPGAANRGRVARGTAFFRGRIGTMLNSQSSFANKLSMVARVSKQVSAQQVEFAIANSTENAKKDELESDSEDESESDDESNSGEVESLSSDSDSESGSESKNTAGDVIARASTITRRGPQRSTIRQTLVKSAQLFKTALSGNANEPNANFMSGSRSSMTAKSKPSTARASFLTGLGKQIRMTVAKVTGAGRRIGGLRRNKKKGNDALIQPKFYCNLNSESVRIPGCHGNSVVKFDFLDGERKIASHLFFMAREGHVMFWGGEYTRQLYVSQARRVGHANAIQLQSDRHDSKKIVDNPNLPYFDYAVFSGSALKSRAQWAKVAIKGNGPAKRAAHKNIFMAFFFTAWKKLFLSMDADGLSIFERKSSTSALIYIPVGEMENVRVEQITTAASTKASRSEDNCCVILTTKLKDEIFIRCQDVASRFAWNDAISKAITEYSSLGKSISSSQPNDLFQTVTSTTKRFTTMVSNGLSKHKRHHSNGAIPGPSSQHSQASIDSLALSPGGSSSWSLTSFSNSQNSLDVGGSSATSPQRSTDGVGSRLSHKRSLNLPTVQEHRDGVDNVAGGSSDDDSDKDEW